MLRSIAVHLSVGTEYCLEKPLTRHLHSGRYTYNRKPYQSFVREHFCIPSICYFHGKNILGTSSIFDIKKLSNFWRRSGKSGQKVKLNLQYFVTLKNAFFFNLSRRKLRKTNEKIEGEESIKTNSVLLEMNYLCISVSA